jgi:predicted lipoprotein with Yx(FWY)xxD motif
MSRWALYQSFTMGAFRMFRTMMIAVAFLASADAALAGGHGSESSAPPPPKPGELPAKAIIGKHGPLLVDLNGMTLYTFDRDDSGTKSACDSACAEKRPPLLASDNATATGDFTVIARSDGKKMWAYRYRPLYTSQLDAAPGDIQGDEPSRLWHLARPY